MMPVLDVSDLVGASFVPSDGQANPGDIAQALAKGARRNGCKIFEGVRVTGVAFEGDRAHTVDTTSGAIACETLVICAGLWSRQLGAMAGVNVALQPIKHQYVVTEALPGLATDAPTVRDPDRRTYFKEEVGGLVFGGYEPNPIPWDENPIPRPFEFQLFDDDWEHFEQHMENALVRVPALAEVGIKQMINGPESFTPDGNFILGRAPERDNVYVGAGFNAFGIASAGGAGWALAQWIADGAPPLDLASVDIRRFSSADRDTSHVRDATLKAYAEHYSLAPTVR